MPALNDMTPNELMKFMTDLNRKTESEKANVAKLEEKVASMTSEIVPAGIKDINKIIWPYTMSTGFMQTSPTVAYANKNLLVNQEAGFVVTKVIHQVFEKMGAGNYRWVDLRNENVEDLFINFSDPQSGRYFAQEPFSINHIGDGQFFTKMFGRPLILPNSAMNAEVTTKSGTKTYFTNISFVGYRVRIEDAQDILGLVNQL